MNTNSPQPSTATNLHTTPNGLRDFYMSPWLELLEQKRAEDAARAAAKTSGATKQAKEVK